VPVRLHWSLALVVPWLAWLVARRLPELAALAGVRVEAMVISPMLTGLGLAVMLLACVVAHELGHVLVAQRLGARVRGVTLLVVGGISEIAGLPRTGRAEGAVAVAGPLVSLALGGGGWLALRELALPADARLWISFLSRANLVLGIFNLLPAFPLDGGRLLRALLAWRGAWERATRVVTALGLFFGAALATLGLLSFQPVSALVGLFIWAGARAERSQLLARAQQGLRVRDVMRPVVELLPADMPVAAAAERMESLDVSSLLVVDRRDRLIGAVTRGQLETLSEPMREAVLLSALVQRDLPRLQAGESLAGAWEQLSERGARVAPVFAGAQLVGLLEIDDQGIARRPATPPPVWTLPPVGARGRSQERPPISP